MNRIAALGIAAACLAVPAAAQDMALGSAELNMIDANGDGAVSREEFDTFAARAFQLMDANSDRMLSPEEAGPDISDAAFADMDTDGDGMVSRQEFGRQMSADFAAADRDGNGMID